MNFEQIVPIIFLIGVLILILPHFLESNSKLKYFFTNLIIWIAIFCIVIFFWFFFLK